MSNKYSDYFEIYYDVNGTANDSDTVWEEAAREHYSDEITECEKALRDCGDEISMVENEIEEEEDSENLSKLETKLEELEEKKQELEEEREEIEEKIRECDDDGITVNYHQIFRVNVAKLLDEVYDNKLKSLNFDKLLKMLSDEIFYWVARHENMLEALLDTSFFDEHKNFFEDLYDKKLVDDKQLLRIFNVCGEFGEYLFVRDHKNLALAILKEAAHQSATKESEYSFKDFEELCDTFNHYATHRIYDECTSYYWNSWSHGLEEESLKPYEIDHEFVKRVERFKVLVILETFNFDENQKLELFDILKDNEIAKERLTQLTDNHIISNFDFESLMVYLKKVEKKNLINI